MSEVSLYRAGVVAGGKGQAFVGLAAREREGERAREREREGETRCAVCKRSSF